MAEQRANSHNSRRGTNGKAINGKHNDRNFEIEKAPHIDGEKSADNVYWLYQQYDRITEIDEQGKEVTRKPTFEEYEQQYYEREFTPYLTAKNDKAIKTRHKERVETMEHFRTENIKGCPEESIFTVGNAKNPVTAEKLTEIYEDYIAWHMEQYPNVKILDAALHVDEQNPHIHIRRVWTATENGLTIVNQEKALAEMGIDRPHPEKKVDRRNNAKMTYTAQCREKLLEVCKAHGVEVIIEPQAPSKSGKDLLQYQCDTIKEEMETLSNRLSELQQSIANGTADKETVIAEVEKIKVELTEYQAKHEALDKRPPERGEPYIPEVPMVGESKGEFRRRVKAAEKDHKAWERENKAREKWDKEHPEGYQKYTAGAVLSLRARNEKDRENIDKEIDRRFAARERSVSAREEAVNEIEYKRFVAPIVARNAIIQAFQRQGVELDLPTYGIQQAIQEHHRSAPKREEIARLKQSAETKDAPAKSNTKENHHER